MTFLFTKPVRAEFLVCVNATNRIKILEWFQGHQQAQFPQVGIRDQSEVVSAAGHSRAVITGLATEGDWISSRQAEASPVHRDGSECVFRNSESYRLYWRNWL